MHQYIINFNRIYFQRKDILNSMKLNLGIKFQDDPQYRKLEQNQSVKLTADRQRSRTDQSLDDLLFGGGAVKRKPRQPAANAGTTPQPTQPVKTLPSIQQKKQPPKVVQPPKPAVVVKQPSIQKPTPPPQPVVKKATVVQPTYQEAPKPTSGRHGFNRPSYIRKLKKIAQNFDFQAINQRSHTYYDIVRPYETERSKIQIHQQLNTKSDGFHDKFFPANNLSIGANSQKQLIQWKRAQQFSNKTVFGKYVQPNDILIGKLSCPSFASVLSCIAERQKNIKRLIQSQQYNPNGFYYVRLNINSVWRYIDVDNFLPESQNDNVGLLSFRDNQSEISLSIIQKAYAKAYGGYDVFQKKCKPEDYLRDLTGARVARHTLNDPILLDVIKQAFDQNWTVVAVPNSRIEELGLNSKYNLSVIGFGASGFQLRNSWGTIVDRPKLNFTREGLFNLSMQQATKYIDYILIAQTDDSYYTSTVQSKHMIGFYSSYSFKIKSPVQGVISASQWDQRLFPRENSYIYSPFRLILDKKDGEKAQYVAGGFSQSSRNLDVLISLTPGVYTVTCIGSWVKGNAYDYSIVLYGNHPVQFDKNYTQFLPNIITKSLQSYNLQNGKRSAKGHVDQYILYHQPTNLVLLTNLNVSQKPYDYTQDLSRINFQTLNLLNAPNEQQHFGNKLEQQVASIKQDHNNERKWSIHLEPKQAYTWVISTRQDYNVNNFKVWGFR